MKVLVKIGQEALTLGKLVVLAHFVEVYVEVCGMVRE